MFEQGKLFFIFILVEVVTEIRVKIDNSTFQFTIIYIRL
jgi:hypothetical protein